MNARRRHALGLALVAAVAAAAALLLGGGASRADPGTPYLALGDSVPFGYIAGAGYEYGNAENFVGYPDYVGEALRLTTANASCPGETTAGFLSASGADHGCRPYRAAFPLHVGYGGTQLDFATSFLHAHQSTRLVTLELGANDAFLLEDSCAGNQACVASGLPAVLASISGNVDTILHDLRAAFHGTLVVVDYYSLNYADPVGTALTQALDAAITAHAQADGALVADAFGAFQQAAAAAGGDTCKAGLLNPSPSTPGACDVHPSQSGQKLLAQAVESAFLTHGGDR